MMNTITEDKIRKIAKLARLNINKEEIALHTQNLGKILDFVTQMDQVPTKKITPLIHPHDGKQRLREDLVTENNQRDLFQTIAPKIMGGLYLVPKVIEACDTGE